MSAKTTQVFLVIGAVLLFVLLLLAPKLAPKKEEEAGHDHAAESSVSIDNASLTVYLNMALKNLDLSQKEKMDQLVASKKFDSLIVTWDKLKRPDLASIYSEEIATSKNKAENWNTAGNRYYYAVQFTKDKTEIPVLYACAKRCYAKAVQLDPKNTDAKIMLASCYVEEGVDPMEGINRLRVIEKTDSNNVRLQITFAMFSLKSNQLDKAIARFNKVIRIDSNYIEAYLHLADAYEQMENKGKTIEMLEKYAARTNDPTAAIEINKYIQQLKNTN